MSATRKPAPSACSCRCSTGIDGSITKGRGKLDDFGFWEIPCTHAQSGAPRQPGATQPEHDGVAHETHVTSPLCENENCGHPYSEHAHDLEGEAWCEVSGCACVDYSGAEPESLLFTHSELTTLLERMARLVVKETTQHVPIVTKEYGLSCSCGWQNSPVSSRPVSLNFISHISSLLTPEKLQQLREAVERP